MIADLHSRPDITDLKPDELDLEPYLRAFILTDDRSVTTKDRRRARRLLTARFDSRPQTCMCFTTLLARDDIEFQTWIDEARADGTSPDSSDEALAACVRRLELGERSDLPLVHDKMKAALEAVITDVRNRSKGTVKPKRRELLVDEPAVAPFWKTVLSSDPTIRPIDRLDAVEALDELNVLERCTCNRPAQMLSEHRVDAWAAYVIRTVGQRHHRAALVVARFPSTFVAVRTATDAVVLAEFAAGRSCRVGPVLRGEGQSPTSPSLRRSGASRPGSVSPRGQSPDVEAGRRRRTRVGYVNPCGMLLGRIRG